MSVAIRSKPLISSVHSTSLSSPSALEAMHPELEAPERAELAREAPELRAGGRSEAPDAGEGRAGLMEHEFTHGRSQS
jgi:hypothetical protein